MRSPPATRPGMIASLSAPALAAGLLAGFVGFASSFAVVLQGLTAMGASPAQAASGSWRCPSPWGSAASCSAWRRMPISIAWSTPGAALLAASAMPEGGFPVAVGAFLVSGALIVLGGLWKPLGRGGRRDPGAAWPAPCWPGCCWPVPGAGRAVAQAPAWGWPSSLAWALVARFNRLMAVPAAVLVAVGLIVATTSSCRPARWRRPAGAGAGRAGNSRWRGIGIALPLFLVTMASQNIPGMAVLTVNGYRPVPGPLFTVTGLFTLAAAPLRRACGQPRRHHRRALRQSGRRARRGPPLAGRGRRRRRLCAVRPAGRHRHRLRRRRAADPDPGGRRPRLAGRLRRRAAGGARGAGRCGRRR